MSGRWQSSSAQQDPTKNKDWISNIRTGSAVSYGNHIKSSCAFIAFNANSPGGGTLGILSLENGSRDKQQVSELPCHADLVTDFDFSPFDDALLATCSADTTVKLWRIPESVEQISGTQNVTLGPEATRVECVLFHPSADAVLASGAGNVAKVWDLTQQKALAALEDHGDQIQSLTWKGDGCLLGSSCKDKMLRVFDPRAKSSAVQSVKGHDAIKDSRLIWLSALDTVLSTGFSQVRERQVRLWDVRRFTTPLSTLTIDTAQGSLIPLYDADSGLLILAGKGDNVLRCFEVSTADATLTQVSQCLTEVKSRGVAAVPKLALDVMSCEVIRLLQLTDNSIVPISYNVPRKSLQEFHTDLFPDTLGKVPSMSALDWFNGSDEQVPRVCLEPGRRRKQHFTSSAVPSPQESETPLKEQTPKGEKETEEGSWGAGNPFQVHSGQMSSSSSNGSLTSPSVTSLSSSSTKSSDLVTTPQSQKSLHSFLGPNSKFKHIQGTVSHRDTHITNLKGLNLTTPGESDGFCVNRERAAVPLLVTGGQVAVLELSKPGRLPDTSLPTIQNGGAVVDLCWDPFDCHRLAVAGEDAKIRIWKVPTGGLTEVLSNPEKVLHGHTEKIYSIRFHPLASDILASSSYDMTVRIWNLSSGKEEILLRGHRDQIFSLSWSPDGQQLVTVSKDGQVRVYQPRRSASPVQEGPGPAGSRGARILWVSHGRYLLVSGFNSLSERQIYLYNVGSLSSGPIATADIDVAPSTLIPFYDEDTSTLYLTGKGDTRVHIFEVQSEDPYFLPCSSFSSANPHKGLCFLPKTECSVREVEIARALCLGHNSLESVIFKVPRVKKEFFQDDIFPDTTIWWRPALSASAWLAGANGQHKKMSLKPDDMTPVSAAPKEAPVRKYQPSSFYLEEKTDEEKKEELLNAMVSKLGNLDDPLPQDSFEGVDEEEWDD
ncbi:coronin-7 isoform X3 [Pristis pectinata]|uniref:coronin-7 isoform X3 n=1 Tax=Pristis pectinata TaxID=685728 RepID=UPI00223CA5A0|nr:coronin-7 isoform X3 [Pristis pectinata]